MTSLHLGIALEDAGWHPAAWREPGARAGELFTAGYWVDQVREAERGLLDFVTLGDGVTLQAGGVRGRLDAVLLAARIAPATSHIGIVPAVDTVVTEPFLVSTQIATLDFVSRGRAGFEVRVPSEGGGGYVGPRPVSAPEARLEEARDYVEVVRRLWDSWEDDAEIRDTRSHRFFDVDKVHHITFEGPHFSIVGPSITPRPPQGQPIVAAAEADLGADIVFGAGFADVVVFLDEEAGAAQARRERLDAIEPRATDTRVFAGTPAELADHLLARTRPDGFRLHPATHAHDLQAITRRLVPELQARGAFRRAYEADTLRGLLGLDRPANRFARA